MQHISGACGPGKRTSRNALYHTKRLKQRINAGLTLQFRLSHIITTILIGNAIKRYVLPPCGVGKGSAMDVSVRARTCARASGDGGEGGICVKSRCPRDDDETSRMHEMDLNNCMLERVLEFCMFQR